MQHQQMQFKYTSGKRELKLLHKHMGIRRILSFSVLMASCFLAAIYFAFCGIQFDVPFYGYVSLVYFTILVLSWFLNRKVNRVVNLKIQTEIFLNESACVIKDELGVVSEYSWSTFQGFRETETHFVLERGYLASFIPKKDFSENHRRVFRDLINQKLSSKSGNSDTEMFRNQIRSGSGSLNPNVVVMDWNESDIDGFAKWDNQLFTPDPTTKPRPRRFFPLYISLGFFVFLTVMAFPNNWFIEVFKIATPLLVFIPFYYLEIRTVNRMLRLYEKFAVGHTLVFLHEDEDLYFGRSDSMTKIKISDIKRIIWNDAVLALVNPNESMMPIPRRFIGDEHDVFEFASRLQNYNSDEVEVFPIESDTPTSHRFLSRCD